MKSHSKANAEPAALVPAGEMQSSGRPSTGGASGRPEAREDHWAEVELFLELWHKVARDWGNDTLLRLVRYAMLEAETERELERGALERPAGPGVANSGSDRNALEAYGAQQAAS